MRLFHGSNASFDAFDCKGLGSHFGDEHQCLRAPGGNAYIYEVDVAITNPLLLTDMYSWDPYDVTMMLSEVFNIDLSDIEHQICLAQGDPAKDQIFLDELKRIIERHGYDGIEYDNTMEGCGRSYIAFHSGQVSIITRRTRDEHKALYPPRIHGGRAVPSIDFLIESLDKVSATSKRGPAQ